MTDTTINLRGLKCPLPALRTRKALSKLQAGDLLTVECTDPLVDIDIPNLIRETGDSIEATMRDADAIIFRIRKRVRPSVCLQQMGLLRDRPPAGIFCGHEWVSSSGLIGSVMICSTLSRSSTSGLANAFTTSWLSFVTMSFGSPGGPASANQVVLTRSG